jgi:hypothetical protein
MVTRGTSVTVVKVLAALATFALVTIVAFWIAGRVLSASLAGYFGLAVGVLATVALVMMFDRFTDVANRSRRRR